MADLRLEHSNYVIYVLQRENKETYTMQNAPEGWDDDDLEIVRNLKYHGILTQFTGGLLFRGGALDFINDSYNMYGLNSNVYLMKYVLRKGESYTMGLASDAIDFLKFKQRYRGIADFNTKKEKKGYLEINFNSQELETLLESHQDDEFSIQRNTSIDEDGISEMPLNNCTIKGRNLEAKGWAKATRTLYSSGDDGESFQFWVTIPTEFGVKGFGRHVEVTNSGFATGDQINFQPNFFYDDLPDAVLTETQLKISAKFKVRFFPTDGITAATVTCYLQPWVFTGDTYLRQTNESTGQLEGKIQVGPARSLNEVIDFNGEIVSYGFGEIPNNRTFSLQFEFTNVTGVVPGWQCEIDTLQDGTPDYRIEVEEISRYNTTGLTYRFSFINEVGSRLMEIITGEKNKFYSKVFGRQGFPPSSGITLPPQYQDYRYRENGEWGNIGLIGGFDIRRFSLDNPLYKSLTTSMKDLIDGLTATFNIGVGIENSEYGQRVRFEPLDYFYQTKTIVRLTNQVSDVEREVDPKMFNSSCSFGQTNGGDYEFGLGLDEPNVSTDFITPLRKTANKYDKKGRIRSDETGQEIIRRQPEELDETADMSGDDNFWYLDLKINQDSIYEQLDWEDVLVSEPIGVQNPDTYRSWRFTPKRCMYRHGWVLRAGMEQPLNLNKLISLGSSDSNVNLITQYIPNTTVREQEGIIREKSTTLVSKLNPAIILPEMITFKHPVNDELMDWIMGTTSVVIGGEVEEVPNWYFKFSFINEKEETETGHLISMKPKTGEFKMYKSNEKIYQTENDSGIIYIFTISYYILVEGLVSFEVSGSGFVDWGDGNLSFYDGVDVIVENDFSFGPASYIKFSGTLTKFDNDSNGIVLTYSISNIPDDVVWFKDKGNDSLVAGDIANLKEGLELFQIEGNNYIQGSVESLPSTIDHFTVQGNNVVSGNISNIPSISNIKILSIEGNSFVSGYTSGTVYSSDIIYFGISPNSTFGYNATQVDDILIDLYNSGMSIGNIIFGANNSARTSASDAAVNGLEGLGVTIQFL
jgi:hypothetical protein